MHKHHLPKAIDDHLLKERAALLAGDFARLAELSDRKTPLFRALSTSGLEPPVLQRIAETVRRNQVLLAATIAGIKEASARIEGYRAGHGFLTYGKEGLRESVDGVRTTLQRRF